jgi:hypothetical protein
MISPRWDDARQELDCWAAQGLKAAFWVRDDDAFETSDRLTRLHTLAERYDITIGLAVIPAKLHPSLPQYLADGGPRFHPMCHGWRHVNHALAGRRPAEFGSERPISALVDDAQLAYRAFTSQFGVTDVVFVPPFGRISRSLVRALPNIGFSGISGAAGWLERRLSRLSDWNIRMPTVASLRRSDVPRLDVQIDPIDWGARRAHDPAIIEHALARSLRARRNGWLASSLPIGVVTHHLDHDETVWRTCDALLGLLRSHEAVEFLHVGDFFSGNRDAAH